MKKETLTTPLIELILNRIEFYKDLPDEVTEISFRFEDRTDEEIQDISEYFGRDIEFSHSFSANRVFVSTGKLCIYCYSVKKKARVIYE